MHQYRKSAENLRTAARNASHANNKKTLAAPLAGSAELAPTGARNDKVVHLQNDLNRQMMRLSLVERQRRWPDYCARLARLRSDID